MSQSVSISLVFPMHKIQILLKNKQTQKKKDNWKTIKTDTFTQTRLFTHVQWAKPIMQTPARLCEILPPSQVNPGLCFSSILYLPLAFDPCRHITGLGLQMEGTSLTDLKAPWLKDQSASTEPSPCRHSWLRTYMPSLEILSLSFTHFSPRHLLCWKTSLAKVAETDLWFGDVKCLTYCSK